MSYSPKSVHFMNYEVKKLDEKDFLKTFSGMLKFAYNNKNGLLEIERCASFLAQSNDTIVELLNVFVESEIIKILEKSPSQFKIEYLSNTELSKALHTNSYKEFLSETKASQDYKSLLLETELNFF